MLSAIGEMMVHETIRNNPVKSAAATITCIVGLVVGIWKIDDRYAHAADLQVFQNSIQQQVMGSINGIRIRELEDELFTLEFLEAQRELVPLEQAKKARVERELDDLKH